jgi:predicted acylesterase/phospholipase RssA
MMEFDMVFEGGGAKGMVFVGASKVLEERGHTVRRLVGTSAGAITATLLAAGYTFKEMQDALQEELPDGRPMFASFMDVPERFDPKVIESSLTMDLFDKVDIPFIPKYLERKIDNFLIGRFMKLPVYRMIFSFVERGGLYAGNAFLTWFRRKLDAKVAGAGDMTLGEFHFNTEHDLSMVASDTSGRSMLVLNHRTAPNCPVAWAVRMSMSIPFAWQEVRWQEEWNPYRRVKDIGIGDELEDTDITGHTIVDGGVLSNFPINLLTSGDPWVKAIMGGTEPDPTSVIGLLIDESLPVEDAPPAPEDDGEEDRIVDEVKKLRTVSRVSRLIGTMTGARDNQLIRSNEKIICRVPAETYGTMEFDMTEERRKALVRAGENAMAAHLDGRNVAGEATEDATA